MCTVCVNAWKATRGTTVVKRYSQFGTNVSCLIFLDSGIPYGYILDWYGMMTMGSAGSRAGLPAYCTALYAHTVSYSSVLQYCRIHKCGRQKNSEFVECVAYVTGILSK